MVNSYDPSGRVYRGLEVDLASMGTGTVDGIYLVSPLSKEVNPSGRAYCILANRMYFPLAEEHLIFLLDTYPVVE